uniref:Uncharacterized protein n=1 Tax=Alexandrium monilatum TaxID=311494 RepID=A0A6T1CEJ5_9DINO|mmetsp:Transcript_7968/g.24201  ORF Transcript_7968/g.24201 Transcript_7968/m.24201 type:complete len:166 (+) Transcript_7968:55-552(+)
MNLARVWAAIILLGPVALVECTPLTTHYAGMEAAGHLSVGPASAPAQAAELLRRERPTPGEYALTALGETQPTQRQWGAGRYLIMREEGAKCKADYYHVTEFDACSKAAVGLGKPWQKADSLSDHIRGCLVMKLPNGKEGITFNTEGHGLGDTDFVHGKPVCQHF